MKRFFWRYFVVALAFFLLCSLIGCMKKDDSSNIDYQYNSCVAGLVGFFQIAINNDDTISVIGNPNETYDFSHWEGVKSVSVGMLNAAGIKEDGTVFITGSKEAGAYQVTQWQDIVNIKFMVDSVCGLKRDGTLVFTKSNDITDKAKNWEDIIQFDVSLLSIVGLKNDGTVIAECPTFPEYEETVKTWRDVKYISTSWDKIVAITNNGGNTGG